MKFPFRARYICGLIDSKKTSEVMLTTSSGVPAISAVDITNGNVWETLIAIQI